MREVGSGEGEGKARWIQESRFVGKGENSV